MFEWVELGHFALVLALGLSFSQVLLGFYGAYDKNLAAIALASRAGVMSFVLVSLSFVILVGAFLANDFTLKYVALNSNVHLDWYYKISATWAGHEGSLLLWVLSLLLWNFLVIIKVKDIPPAFKAKVIAVMAVIALGFLSFIVFTSNPFERLLPTNDLSPPLIGKDLNPLLQDIGLILHPPLLYMGYVGFAVSFAFIVAALLEGRLDSHSAKLARTWTMAAWAFLTLGITLGSWWAYYELGWGGWWFWDPVENASLMPWLLGTALIHSLAVTQKRNVFKIWTAFLSIATFSLSLIGTFLVRSGVLTSVHAFASDPTRGLYILMLLTLIAGSAFLLLLLRSHRLQSIGRFGTLSREMMLVVNNILLSLACLIVFVGTLAPLLYDVLGLERISVGAPYFNAKMLWVLVMILVFLSFAPYLRWNKDSMRRIMPHTLAMLALGAIMSSAMIAQFAFFDITAFALLSLVITALLMVLWDIVLIVRKHNSLPVRSYWAMVLGHGGFLITCIGIILAGTYSVEKDVYINLNERAHLHHYSFEAKQLTEQRTKQFDSATIDFIVRDSDTGQVITLLQPQKRLYHITQMPISESAILPRLDKDIYVALGQAQGDGGWSVRLQIKPFVRFLWLGGLIMALASVFIIFRRRRLKESR